MEAKNVICLTNPSDIAFSSIAQKSTVTAATLPRKECRCHGSKGNLPRS